MRPLVLDAVLYAVLCVLVSGVNARIGAELGDSVALFAGQSEPTRRDVVDSVVAELRAGDQVLDTTMRQYLEAPNHRPPALITSTEAIRATEQLLAAGAEAVFPARIQREADGTETVTLVVVAIRDEEGPVTESVVGQAMQICAVDAAQMQLPGAAVRRGHRFVLLDIGCEWRTP